MNLSIFEFYNQNPNAACPSLTADSAVCLLVINATAAALGMGPANKAAGSAPYVSVAMVFSMFPARAKSWLGLYNLVHYCQGR
jgi:hypothetical protein